MDRSPTSPGSPEGQPGDPERARQVADDHHRAQAARLPIPLVISPEECQRDCASRSPKGWPVTSSYGSALGKDGKRGLPTASNWSTPTPWPPPSPGSQMSSSTASPPRDTPTWCATSRPNCPCRCCSRCSAAHLTSVGASCRPWSSCSTPRRTPSRPMPSCGGRLPGTGAPQAPSARGGRHLLAAGPPGPADRRRDDPANPARHRRWHRTEHQPAVERPAADRWATPRPIALLAGIRTAGSPHQYDVRLGAVMADAGDPYSALGCGI